MKRPAHQYQDSSRGERLQRVLADRGVASRRRCEELIEQGHVTVNGKVIRNLPAWVNSRIDKIAVDGRIIRPLQPHVYIMLFKPRGYVCTNSDPEGRRIALDLVDHPLKPSLYCVGRLDLESSGLLLLTNDGELSNRLTHPSRGVQKIYEVTVHGSLSVEEVKKLEQGFFLNELRTSKGNRPGRKTSPVNLRVLKRETDRTRLLMELHEGRNRQIRRMLAEVDHEVKKLRRIQIGPLKLKGLQPGQWRELTHPELKSLRRAVHMEDHDASSNPSVRKTRRKADGSQRAAAQEK